LSNLLYSQVAVVKGAALRGLEGIAPQKRKCKRHYGFKTNKTFREGIDEERHSCVRTFDGLKLCDGRASWVISKVSKASTLIDDRVNMVQGEEIRRDTSKKFSYTKPFIIDSQDKKFSMEFFSTPVIHAPERMDHPSMYLVVLQMPQFTNLNRGRPYWRNCCRPFSSIQEGQVPD
jgi:hypothetical protein